MNNEQAQAAPTAAPKQIDVAEIMATQRALAKVGGDLATMTAQTEFWKIKAQEQGARADGLQQVLDAQQSAEDDAVELAAVPDEEVDNNDSEDAQEDAES